MPRKPTSPNTSPKKGIKRKRQSEPHDETAPGRSSQTVPEDTELPRLKRYRAACPQSVLQRRHRVLTQRMFCLGRERDEVNLMEDFKIAGSTGNVYTVTITNIPTCDCPDSIKNGTCKHILFVMMKVLRVRDDLSYQAALLNSELAEIFANSSIPAEGDTPGDKRQRKPLDSDECPVCYESFQENEKNVLFCVAQCGSNIHKECFRQWATSRGGQVVTCVMCRTPWEESSANQGDYGNILQSAKYGNEGYLNVGKQLGMDSRRDTSTYYSRRYRRRYNHEYDDDDDWE